MTSSLPRVPFDVKQEIARACRPYAGVQSRVRGVLLPLLIKHHVTTETFFDATSAIDRYRTDILSDPRVWSALPGFSWNPRVLEPFLNAWVLATGEYRYTLFRQQAIFSEVKWTPSFLRTCISKEWVVLKDMTAAQYQCLGPATRLTVLRLLLQEDIPTETTAWQNILGDPSIGYETLTGLFQATSRVKQEKRMPQGGLVLRCLLRRIDWAESASEPAWAAVLAAVERVSGANLQVTAHLLALALQDEPSISTAGISTAWIERLRQHPDFACLAPRIWRDRVSADDGQELLELLGGHINSTEGVLAVIAHPGLHASRRGAFFIEKLPLIDWEFSASSASAMFDAVELRPLLAMIHAKPSYHGIDMVDCGWSWELFRLEPGDSAVLDQHAPAAAEVLPLAEALGMSLLQWWNNSYGLERGLSAEPLPELER